MKHTYTPRRIIPLSDFFAFVLLPIWLFLCVAMALSTGQLYQIYEVDDHQIAKTIEQLKDDDE